MWRRGLAHERLSELFVDFPKLQQFPGFFFFFCLPVCFLKCNSKGSTFSMAIAQNMIICVRSRQAQCSSRGAGISLPSVTWCAPTLTPTTFSGLCYSGQCAESWLESERRARELQLVKIHLKRFTKKPRGMVFPRNVNERFRTWVLIVAVLLLEPWWWLCQHCHCSPCCRHIITL